MLKKSIIGILLFLAISFPLSSWAAFSNLVSFGDSLSDNGTDPTDVHGVRHFTNGKVWVETLADIMGVTLYDHAYGGATTGYDNPAIGSPVTGLQWQVEEAFPAVSGNDTLFTVWAGANDFFQGRDFSLAVTNIGTALGKLKEKGAQSILVLNLPDLGLTPGFYNNANPYVTTAQASGWTQGFNNQLNGVLQSFAVENSSIDIYFLDVFSLFSDFILMDNGKVNPVYWSLLFWDSVHPTNIGHAIFAGEAYGVLQSGPMAAAPVPGAFLMLGSGLLFMVGIRRKA